MEARINYLLIGVFVILLALGLLASGFWLGTEGHRKSYDRYTIYVNESVSGLSVQAPVKFNGVAVGFVENMALDYLNPQRVKLTLKIEKNVPITTATTAQMTSNGFTGIAFIGLKANGSQGTKLSPPKDEKYPVIATENSLFVHVDSAIREITSNLNNISHSLSTFLSENNQKALENSLSNLESFSKMLASNSPELDSGIKHVNKLLQNAAMASEQLTSVFQRFNLAVTNLEQLSDTLNADPSVLIRGQETAPAGPGEN